MMEMDRYRHLDKTGEAPSQEETLMGWHYCAEWDDMLIGPIMEMEWSCCLCRIKKEYHVED